MVAIATPGVNIQSRTSVTPQTLPVNTDTVFAVGVTQQGRTDQPVLIKSMQDYLVNFGARVSYGTLYDWLDAFFNGASGGQVYVVRVVGPSSTVDTHTFNDSGSVASISVQSIGQGASGLSVAIITGISAGSFRIVVTGLPDGSTLTSTDLITVQDAVNWGSAQALIRVNALGANPPLNITATALTGGNDQHASITDTQKAAGLTLIPFGLGMGQVVCPTSTSESMIIALLNHAQANNRYALIAAPDSNSASTLSGAAATAQVDGSINAGALEYCLYCADWKIIPGLTQGSTRTVDPTAAVAAAIAVSDRASGNPNLAAAGANGEDNYSLAKTQTDWTDAQTTALVAAGVNPSRVIFGGLRFYSFRTLANPSTDQVFVMATAGRLRMAIQNQGYIIGQSVLMGEIDGKGQEAAKYGSKISGYLLGLYTDGALYGDTAADAYVVDVGADVNTPTSIANRELHAAVGIKPSPFAETVYFALAAYPANQPV